MESRLARTLRYVYARQILYSLGHNMANPFMAPYLAKLGASAFQLGLYSSVGGLLSYMTQVFWARVYGLLGRLLPFVAFGGVAVFFLWILIALSNNVYEIMGIVWVQAALGAMIVPAFSAYLVELAPPTRRGAVSASANMAAAAGGLFATLLTGYLTLREGGSAKHPLLLPFTIAASLGIAGSLMMLLPSEAEKKASGNRFRLVNLDPLRKNRDFRTFALAGSTNVFATSLTAGLFPITQIDVLQASLWDMAVFSVAGSAATIVLQQYAGRLADRVGRRPLMVCGSLAGASIPLIYFFADNFAYLVFSNVLSGAISAFTGVATLSYMLDVSQKEEAADYFALNNALTGIASSTGSLLGGLLGGLTIGRLGLVRGLQAMYVAAFLTRLAGATLYFRVKEVINQQKSPDRQ